MAGVVVIVIIIILGVLYYFAGEARNKVRRKGSKKTEYTKERSLTDNYTAITTSASVQQVKDSINSRLTIAKTQKDDFKGDNYRIVSDSESQTTYKHNSTLNVVSDVADEFTARVGYKSNPDGLRVMVQILQWQEKKGVATRTALDAMQDFIDTIIASVRSIDPSARVETRPVPNNK